MMPQSGSAATSRRYGSCSCLKCPSAIVVVLALMTCHASKVANGPVGGVPFTYNIPLGTLPSVDTDGEDATMVVFRLQHGTGKGQNAAGEPAHACDMGDAADMTKCLNVDRGCMWTSVTTRDPFRRTQAINSYCLPCEMDGNVIPCWNPGAWVGGKQVLDCKMSCQHQERIWQPEYACSDETGFISQSQCFDRAAQSGSKCMFIEYDDPDGKPKASCAPCELSGSGGWGCPTTGEAGPVAGSTVTGCISQCDVLCAGPPACPPTVAPPPPPPLQQSPGLPDGSSPPDKMLTAPQPWIPVPAPDPMAIIEAARDAAKKLGYKVAPPPPPPKVYWPVVFYRSPGDYMFTTGPPPLEGPEPPIAPALVQEPGQAAGEQRMPRQAFLSRLRRTAFGEKA